MPVESFSGFEEFPAPEKDKKRYRTHAFLHDRNRQLVFIQLIHPVKVPHADIEHLVVAAQTVISAAEAKFYANYGREGQFNLLAIARIFFSASGFELFASEELTNMARNTESSVH